MQFGFAKVDITPRVGVGLYGYGAYLCRFSDRVRDRLYARAMAVSDGGETVVVVSCDLVGVEGSVTEEVRERVAERTGLPADHILVHCTHTHCGPRTKYGIGQGMRDEPYMEFHQLFTIEEGRMGVVVSFLAIMELSKEHLVDIVQHEPMGRIYVKAPGHGEPENH